MAQRFVRAWSRGDYAAMYADVDESTRRSLDEARFAGEYRAALTTATASSLRPVGRIRSESGGRLALTVAVHTRVFGVLREPLTLSFVDESSGPHVRWSPALLFPGLRAGETLTNHIVMPARAALLARDGSVLASGPPSTDGGVRYSPLGAVADTVVGKTGPIPADELASLMAQGVPPTADVGLTGLERALDSRLRGQPGGELLASTRVLARTPPRAAAPVTTTISPAVQRAAVLSLGGQLGGVVALRPSDGELLAVAGLGIDDLQPPGSTFKMVTVSAALTYGLARPTTVFPYRTAAVLDGVQLQNANGESCGGTLELAFAVSCNSVFSPLGARLGPARLVAMAERFGFNQPTGISGAVTSTIPPASQIVGDFATGSTAIGQGQVDASALEMATIAATIADDGLRPQIITTPPAQGAATTPAGRAISPTVAHEVRRMMTDVVREGTGTSAAIPGVTVAGKTGTAELTNTAGTCPAGAAPGSSACTQSGKSSPKNTDAWFAAFAPALAPRVAVAVMLVGDGAGGDTAAPVARSVIETALSSG